MEAERGLMYPCQIMLDDVQIDASSYTVVKVDLVHENSKDLKLKVPPDDTTLIREMQLLEGFSGGLLLILTHQQQLQHRPLLVSRILLLLQYFLRHAYLHL
jgi:hypothetical protein